MRASNGSENISSSPLNHQDARFIQLRKINWKDPSGRSRVWECADRTTRGSGGIDGVGMVAILKDPSIGHLVVLGKQFRPPTSK